jgi:glycyl-tRNA synthetase beta chain
VAAIREFFRDRLYNAAIDRGYRHDFVRAVLAAGYDAVSDFWRRLEALLYCAGQEWWPQLVEVVDRTYRIQRDSEIVDIRPELLTEPLEQQLEAALSERREGIAALLDAGNYERAAEDYCRTFAKVVHDFFEEVFVNVDDEAVRINRKSLCGHVYRLFADGFADLYMIETAETQ